MIVRKIRETIDLLRNIDNRLGIIEHQLENKGLTNISNVNENNIPYRVTIMMLDNNTLNVVSKNPESVWIYGEDQSICSLGRKVIESYGGTCKGIINAIGKEYMTNDVVMACIPMDQYVEKYDAISSIFNNVIHFASIDKSRIIGSVIENNGDIMTPSCICTYDDFTKDWFRKLMAELMCPPNSIHRKGWEFCSITKALIDNGMLHEGKKGLGFAVGTEPLPSYFAQRGCKILATDLGNTNEMASVWADANQNALGNIEHLYKAEICTRENFRNVDYKDVDMNNIPQEFDGQFDFCWSSCAIEHVGSLEKSKTFLKNMIKVLKPGGVAVHTTEFNLSSNTDTITEGMSVIYRKKDILEMKEWYKQNGCDMNFSFYRSHKAQNQYVDMPPYNSDWHLNLVLQGYMSTSIILIIHKQ